MNRIFHTTNISKIFYAPTLPIRMWRGIVVLPNYVTTPDDYLAGNDLNTYYETRTQFGFPVSMLINRNGTIQYSNRWVKQTSSYTFKGYNYKYMSIMLSCNPVKEDIPEPEKKVLHELVGRLCSFLFKEGPKVFDKDIEDIKTLEITEGGKPVDLWKYNIVPDYAIKMTERWKCVNLKELLEDSNEGIS